jgi:Tfp pilus assembly protein PilO
MNRNRTWGALTALAVLAVLAGGWFALVQPQRSEASSLRQQADQQVSTNAGLSTKLATLKAQAKDLPKTQARLAEIRSHFAETPGLPAVIRSLTKEAAASGIVLKTLTPSAVTPLASSTKPGAAGAAGTAAADPRAATPPAPSSAAGAVAAVPVSGLYILPIEIVAVGKFPQLERFVNRIEDMQRSMLISGLDIGPDASTGTVVATTVGDSPSLTMTVSGRLFVATPAGGSTAATS